MTQQQRAPEPYGEDWKTWGRRLMQHLAQIRSPLVQQTGNESAADDGTLMWDRVNKYPVVSKNGEWRQIVLEDGHYDGVVSTDQTATSINTAYTLTFTQTLAAGITAGTPASRLVVSEGGQFFVSFSAQIASSSASTLTFYFWFRINGVDVPHSTMENSLHRNNATLATSRSTILQLVANDYVELMWAVDSTSGTLQASAATAFAPANPAATLSIVRLHG